MLRVSCVRLHHGVDVMVVGFLGRIRERILPVRFSTRRAIMILLLSGIGYVAVI